MSGMTGGMQSSKRISLFLLQVCPELAVCKAPMLAAEDGLVHHPYCGVNKWLSRPDVLLSLGISSVTRMGILPKAKGKIITVHTNALKNYQLEQLDNKLRAPDR